MNSWAGRFNMDKESPEKNEMYNRLMDYSRKYFPYKWLVKFGFKNLDRDQFIYFLSRFGFSITLSLICLLAYFIFENYPDKTPIFTTYLVFAALNAWHGGLKTGFFSIITLTTGTYFFTKFYSPHELNSILLIQLAVFSTGAVILSFLINQTRQMREIKKLKKQEKIYARTFAELHKDYLKAKKEIKARDEFLSLVSHELKTPLTTMLLRLHNMLNNIRNVSLANFSIQELMNVLKNAEKQINSLKVIVNDLLNVSLITTGRMNLIAEDVDLGDITKHVLQNFSEVLKRENYQIKIEINSPVIGKWDKTRITEAITNLVSNAIKYGRGKPIYIEVLNDRGVGKFIIQDGGIGISSKEQEAIFDLFHRATNSEEYNNGFGIGLYITSRIVKLHGGKIKVSSVPMKGSKFTIELPLKK